MSTKIHPLEEYEGRTEDISIAYSPFVIYEF